jgi:hypothetical protein
LKILLKFTQLPNKSAYLLGTNAVSFKLSNLISKSQESAVDIIVNIAEYLIQKDIGQICSNYREQGGEVCRLCQHQLTQAPFCLQERIAFGFITNCVCVCVCVCMCVCACVFYELILFSFTLHC